MALTAHTSDFRGTDPVWMLDLEWAGEVWRVSTLPVNVVDSGGRSLSYIGGMDEPRSFSETLGRLEIDPGQASARVRVQLPVSVGERVAQGHDLLAARATLYLGTVQRLRSAYDVPTLSQQDHQRWHQITGVVRSATFAVPGEDAGVLAFTIQEEVYQQPGGKLLEPFARLTYDSFLSGPQGSVYGKVAPLVIGAPGAATISGSPAYYIGAGTALDGTSGGWNVINVGPVGATSVTLRYRSGTSFTSGTANVYNVKLGTGQIVACVNGTGLSGGIVGTEELPAYAIWNQGGGGALGPYSTGAISDAAEVAAFMLDRAGMDVDVPRWLALRGRGSFSVATYVNDVDLLASDWLEGTGLLDQMAVCVRRGEQGLYPVPYDPHIYYDKTLSHMVEGRDWHAVSPVEIATEPEDVINAAHVQFARSAETEELVYNRYYGDSEPGFRRWTTHAINTSISRYGLVSEPLEFENIWDDSDAHRIASRYIGLRCLPTFTRSYNAPWFWGWLNVGDALRLTDGAAGWTNVVGIVNSKKWSGTQWEFEVIVDEDLIRDSRPY